ncbi:hypothetical protein [uncultured Arcticibacterium sp.]|uniref:hypothetical protein n=1 Tax=uncultured Arcticibacterium sp. TaxID=2173042 RepID=UPI0030FCC605
MKKLLTISFLILVSYSVHCQSFAAMEYFFDSDPGFGNGTVLTGVPAGSNVNFNKNIVIPISLTPGVHTLNIRGSNSGGGVLRNRWSLVKPIHLLVFNATSGTSNSDGINRIEYFWDTDLGFGSNTIQTISPNSSGNVAIIIAIPSGISPGFHFLHVRTRTKRGAWSIANAVPFIVWSSTINNAASKIMALEYYLDTDPGYGNGINIPFSPNPSFEVNLNFPLSLINIPTGDHYIHLRAKNEDGKWSATKSTLLNVSCASGVKLYSASTGNWTSTTTWACGRVPSLAEDVYINNPHKVVLNPSETGFANSIDNANGAVLDIRAGSVLKVK